jgi:ATP-binding cassette, subfamily C, bacterial LapB
VVLPETGLGAAELPRAELAGRHTGYALFAAPEAPPAGPTDQAAADARGGHWFWRVVLRQWPVYAEVALAAALINLFALASPLFIMNVYDRVVPNNALATLWVLASGVLVVFGFDFLLKLLRAHFLDVAGRVADLKLAGAVFAQVLGIQLAARPASAGAFANDLREFETLREFFGSASVTALVDLPFLVLFVAATWLIGGWVALVPAVAVPLVLLVGLLVQVPLDRAARASLHEAARRHGVLVEAINGLETIKTLGAEGRAQAAWERLVAASSRAAGTSRFWAAFATHFTGLAANLVTVGVVIVGVHEIAAGRLTVGALVACSILAGRAMAPLAQLAAVLSRYHQARAALASLDRVMRLPVERGPGRRFLHRPELEGALELRQVRFTYPRQTLPALADVSFKIAAGERVGLVGRVGSGKTTVEKLLLGLYQPDSGAVLVDGTELRQVDPADLRRNVGCVPQDLYLFQGTLRENIALGAPQADDAAVLRAARAAGVDDFARHHPSGYDMPVGERGETLSGGQRQAVALARALLLEPPVLVLDEPTSFMDNAAESRFKARLGAELAGRTLLLITHRASLLSLVDRLIVLDGGRVVADGPREDVLRRLAEGTPRGAG